MIKGHADVIGVLLLLLSVIGVLVVIAVVRAIRRRKYLALRNDIQASLGLDKWLYEEDDDFVRMKSSKGVDNYQPIQYFKDNRNKVKEAAEILQHKKEYASTLSRFLEENEYMDCMMYPDVAKEIRVNIERCFTYDVSVRYVSPAGRSSNEKVIQYDKQFIDRLISDPSLLMSKTELNQHIKEENRRKLEEKQHSYYEKVNKIIDFSNKYGDRLIISGDKEELDKKIATLFDRTVNSIKKVKDISSDEWEVIGNYIKNLSADVKGIFQRNKQILDYYNSSEFARIKAACGSMMESQREFNDYIKEKAQAISDLFGKRVVRNETIISDEYNYVRPYKKTITPFTAEVSAQVFASAENNPIEYIIKYFYPSKDQYPEQIQKLQLLIEELETLKDARRIIDNYKKDYEQYFTDVPSFVLENDEEGFYSRLGFANVSEEALTVEYRFCYTSGGGFAQRDFSVPMTEKTIVELINILQNKLTMSAFTKEQRGLMTFKLRQQVKERDNYTCRYCGNSTYKEPNLLLEIDHIIPVSKGGVTELNNLQTLCWKCNRSKSNRIVSASF